MNIKLFQFSRLTLCILFNLLSFTAVEQLLSDNKYKLGQSNRAIAQTAEEQIARSVYKKVSPAVVTVKDGRGHGSGFVVSQDGLIVTNAHVVEESPSVVTVEFNAPIYGGNSGGLLLNSKAQVIAVNTSIITDSDKKLNIGMNFAIPVSNVRSFITAAIKKDLFPVSTLAKPQHQEFTAISLNGQIINDKLTKDNSFVNLYVFRGKAEQKIVIEMTSKTMNPALALYQLVETPEGNQANKIVENDDRGAGDFNSRIATTLPADGVYVIEAKSSTGSQSGNYSLQVIVKP